MRVGRPLVSTMSLMVMGTPSMSVKPLAALLPALLRGARRAHRAVGIEMLESVELRG